MCPRTQIRARARPVIASWQSLAARRREIEQAGEVGVAARSLSHLTSSPPAHLTTRKFVSLLAILFCFTSAARGEYDNVTATVYVGRQFEVRDHDQPVKYVFNGDTRVARITGSLSANSRIQRLRLRAGWNLVSLAVSAPDLFGQLQQFTVDPAPLVSDLYRWLPATSEYSAVPAGQSAAAGTVLWIRARTNQVISVQGEYTEPSAPRVPAGGSYTAGPGLETWPLSLPPGVTLWKFDADTGRWQAGFASDLAPLSDLPPTLAPGDAIYIHSAEAVELPISDPAHRIAYYHQDHLGSSTVVTDANGRCLEETAYYPSGAKRNEYRLAAAETYYEFIQKERDGETGLMDFGMRYYHPVLGRWLSVDPLEEKGGSLNLYAYAKQNPLKYRDPDGAEITVSASVDKKTHETVYEIKLTAVLLDVSGNPKITKKALEEYAQKLKGTIEASYRGHDDKTKTRWKTTVDLHVISDSSQRKANEHVFLITGGYKMSGAGETRHGGMIMKIQAHTLLDQPPRHGDKNYDILKKSYKSPESVGAHEFGHAAGLDDLEDNTSNLLSHGRLNDQKIITLEQIKTIVSSPHNLPDD